MAKKKLQRTTILLFIFITSSFLFSLSLCSDHARNNANHHGGGPQARPNKQNILSMRKSNPEGAKRVQEKTKLEEDKKERKKDKGKLESSSSTTSTSKEKSEARGEANNSTVNELVSKAQEINDEDSQIQKSGTIVDGNIEEVEQDVVRYTEDKQVVEEMGQEVVGCREDKQVLKEQGKEIVRSREDKQVVEEMGQEIVGSTEDEQVKEEEKEIIRSREDKQVIEEEGKEIMGFREDKQVVEEMRQEIVGSREDVQVVEEQGKEIVGSRENKQVVEEDVSVAESIQDKQIDEVRKEVGSTQGEDIQEMGNQVVGSMQGEEDMEEQVEDFTKDEKIDDEVEQKTGTSMHSDESGIQEGVGEQFIGKQLHKRNEFMEDLIDDSGVDQTIQSDQSQSMNVEDFLRLNIDEEIKASKKESSVKGKDESEGEQIDSDKQSYNETIVKDNVQYSNDEIRLPETNESKVVEEIEKVKRESTKEEEVGKSAEEVEDVKTDVEKEKLGKADDEKVYKQSEATIKDQEMEEQTVKEDDEKKVIEEEIDPMPSFDEWKQVMLELNEQEKMKSKANVDGQPLPIPRHNPKLYNKNYASVDCGAKIVDSNKESKGTTSAILSSNKDEYMLNPCSAKIWFTVEMCEPIQVKRVEIANLELFSSTPESFKVFTSDRYPTAYWREVGLFYARDERSLQTFTVHDETLFTKFIKVEFLTFFGKEHYCPISLLRVFGTSMEEEIDSESEHEIDPSPVEVLPAHPTVAPEDNSGDGLFDSVIKIVKEAAKAFHAEVRIPSVVEDICKDELLSCFPYSNGVSRNSNKVLHESDTGNKDRIKTSKTATEANQHDVNASNSKTKQDSPSEPIIRHIGCKSCQYSFRPHYADTFHKCHLVKLSISEFGLYLCCYDAPIRTLIYNGAIGLKASTIDQCNTTSIKAPSSNISSKVIEGSVVSVSEPLPSSVNVQSVNVQSTLNGVLDSTPTISASSESSKETPPLPGNTSYSKADEKNVSDINEDNISLKENDADKTSNSKEEDLKTKDVNKQVEEELKVVSGSAPTSSNVIKDSDIIAEVTRGDPVSNSHSGVDIDSLKTEEKENQVKPKAESQSVEIKHSKEPVLEKLNDDGLKPSGDGSSASIKEQSLSDTTSLSPNKSSEAAPTSKSNGSNGQENSTKSKTNDGLAASSFGIGTPKESVLMRLNNRIKSLEVNLSLSSLYLQELSQRYKKQMDDMRKTYDTKVAKLYEDAMIAEEKKQIQAEHVKDLQSEVKKLKSSLHEMNVTIENLHKQTLESHFILMLVEVTIVCFLLLCTRSRRHVPEPVPRTAQMTSLTTLAKSHGRRNSYSGRIDHISVSKPPHKGTTLEGGSNELLIIQPPTPIRQVSLQVNENTKNRRIKNKQKQKNNLKSTSSSNLKKEIKKPKTGSSKPGSISSAGLLFGMDKEPSGKQNGACNGRIKRPKSTDNLTRIEDVPHAVGQDRFNFCNGY